MSADSIIANPVILEELRNAIVSEDTTFTPVLSGWTGTATIGSVKCKRVGNICFFSVSIAPLPTVSTVGGTSKITGLPFVAENGRYSATVLDATTYSSLGEGFVNGSDQFIYMPTLTSVTDELCVVGWYFITVI